MKIKYLQAASVLHRGGVIAYPTEAVWGIGCDPHSTIALESLLRLKRRDPAKGLILIAASMDQFAPYLDGLESPLLEALTASWPGPRTWLVPDNGFAHPLVSGEHSSIALRVSAHKPVVDLCLAYGGPIVSTSANISGRLPPRWPWQFHHQFLNQLDYLVHAELGTEEKPSEIRDLLSGKVLRSA